MEYGFSVKSELTLEHNKGNDKSTHKYCDFSMEISPNLDPKHYEDAEGLPTKEGSKAVTLTLVSALSANIHMAHQKGFRDSAEHLRYIISELERQFVLHGTISTEKKSK